MGNLGPLGAISIHGREAVQAFWTTPLSLPFAGVSSDRHARGSRGFRGCVAARRGRNPAGVLGRAVAIYPCCFLFSWSALRVTWRHQHILFWGGLRGALALALGAGPSAGSARPGIHHHHQLCRGRIFGLVQGLTMTPLLRRLGEIPGRSPMPTQ